MPGGVTLPRNRPESSLIRGGGDPLPVPRSVHDYGVIGNLHTAALVSRFGSVDWACLPRFASPSVFGRLLDARRGGYIAIRPVRSGTSRQSYRPSTNVLDTQFELGDRRFQITDLMPILPDAAAEYSPIILRFVRAELAPVAIRLEFAPRFDYARALPAFDEVDGGWVAHAKRSSLLIRVPWALRREGQSLVGETTLAPGTTAAVELIWGTERPVGSPAFALLEETERYWRHWVHRPGTPFHAIDHPWHSWVERSELTLKLLSHSQTGAFVAAPTTSLPEWPGGSRNWDYRFVWVRDAAFSAQALLQLGHVQEASSFLRWILHRVAKTEGHHLRVVYGAHGETDLSEKELDHLSGFLQSRPVRIGNQAAEQHQLDIYGELFDAATLLFALDPTFPRDSWSVLASLADQVAKLRRLPDHGIWEIRGAPAHYVHSQLMAWVALDRASGLARRFGHAAKARRWSEEAAKVRASILRRGVDPKTGGFVQAYGRRTIDAANLRIPLVGLLPFNDPRVVATLDWVDRELKRGPFLYRYRGDDGLPGPEGTFLPCAFWRVECLARLGRLSEARRDFAHLLAAASPLGLLPEEYDPVRGVPLGNYPQAFTHIALLRAAAALGLAKDQTTPVSALR